MDVTQLIKQHLPDAEVEVTEMTGNHNHRHVGLVVVSDAFAGQTLLAQHRMVMDILKEQLQEEIHALKLKTMTHKQKAIA